MSQRGYHRCSLCTHRRIVFDWVDRYFISKRLAYLFQNFKAQRELVLDFQVSRRRLRSLKSTLRGFESRTRIHIGTALRKVDRGHRHHIGFEDVERRVFAAALWLAQTPGHRSSENAPRNPAVLPPWPKLCPDGKCLALARWRAWRWKIPMIATL